MRAQAGPPEERWIARRTPHGTLDPARPYDRSVLIPYPKGVTLTAESGHAMKRAHDI
jgi:hypothetical protein